MATFAARCASLLGRTCTKNEAHGGAGYVALLGDFGEIFVFFGKFSILNPRNGREQGQVTYPEQGQSVRRRGGRIHSTLDNR